VPKKGGETVKNDFLQSIFGSWVTSLIGSVAGIPEMIEGYSSHDGTAVIKGLGIFLLGLAARNK